MLEALQKANPHIQIHSVHEAVFASYGRFIEEDTTEICAAAEKLPFPEEGSRYMAAEASLEATEFAKRLREEYCGQLDEQVGICYGHSNRLNALEWHTCNEFNVAVRPLVLLLAKRGDMDEKGRLDAAKVKAFYLAQGEMIEVYSDTLHFCPCEVTTDGFSSIVGLQRDTNLPLQDRKQELLWARNKWLIAHEDNAPLVARGAVPGIYGENWTIYPVK
jgi:hypothetical protein